jgi:hypothetical protein
MSALFVSTLLLVMVTSITGIACLLGFGVLLKK